MSGEAPTTSPDYTLEGELAGLAEAHAAVADALRRLFNAIASGPETLIGIERLRLENCMDLYRNRAAAIQAAFEVCASEAAERDRLDSPGRCGADELLLLRGHEVGMQPAHGRLAEAQSSAAVLS